MKRLFAKCDKCKKETIHSTQKRTGKNHKMKREVDRCDECGFTTIRNRIRTWTKGGNNEVKK